MICRNGDKIKGSLIHEEYVQEAIYLMNMPKQQNESRQLKEKIKERVV
jgi:hypothetical protein